MKRIAFIINPISGKGSKKDLPELIEKYIDKSRFTTQIFHTERRNHASELAKELSQKGYEKIVAVGGDGTVNEVAKSLLFNSSSLGIIPFGSGNGLARHLKIPLDTIGALKLINADHEIIMDSASMNGVPFFCTSGVGFDAYIGKVFSEQKTRGLNTYIKSTLKNFITYKPHHYIIKSAIGEIDTNAFLITIGNTSQYGNDAFICPYADVQDGMLDVTILKPFPKFFALDIGRRVFGKSIEGSRFSTLFKTTSLTISREAAGPVHVDGEPLEMGKELLIEIIPSSLKVMVLP